MRFSDRNTAGIEPKKWRLNNVKLDNSWGLKRKKTWWMILDLDGTPQDWWVGPKVEDTLP